MTVWEGLRATKKEYNKVLAYPGLAGVGKPLLPLDLQKQDEGQGCLSELQLWLSCAAATTWQGQSQG